MTDNLRSKRGGGTDQEEKHGDKSERARKDALDEALEETFPGSDPVSVVQPAKSPKDKK
jgi:hypothetical protein